MKSIAILIALFTCFALPAEALAADAASASPHTDPAAAPASADARLVADWVADHADNQHMPFAVVDKKNTRVFVFDANGQLRGTTRVLLGRGIGDESVPGIAGRTIASLRPAERTTPAGRFVSEPGHNLQGENIVWVDYNAKIAIHRLRPDTGREHRAQRMVSSRADDKRISAGCIVVPVSFYDSVIAPVLGAGRGVVYVLPETRPVDSLLSALQLSQN